MPMDAARYRTIFVEDAGDHLREMEGALLALEKDPADADALEACFRLAHSVKGMAAALGFTPIAERAHRLEDGLSAARSAGRADPSALPEWIGLVDVLARFVASVRDTGACPDAEEAGVEAPKKARHRPEPTRTPAGCPRPPSGSAPRRSTGFWAASES